MLQSALSHEMLTGHDAGAPPRSFEVAAARSATVSSTCGQEAMLPAPPSRVEHAEAGFLSA